MANNYLTSDLISKEAAALFKVYSSFFMTGYRGFEMMFDKTQYAPGQTINVRLDNFYEVSRGDVIPAQDIVEQSIPVTMQPLFSVAIRYLPTDLQRDIVSFSNEFIEPAIRGLVAEINSVLYQYALLQINNFAGSASSPLNSLPTLDQINPVMRALGMNRMYRQYASLSPFDAQQLRSSTQLYNSFNTMLNTEITRDAAIGHLVKFDIFEDESIGQFVAGTHTAPGNVTVATAVSTGNTIALTGFTPGATVVAGDIFSIAGTNSWNNVLQKPVPQMPAQFVIQAPVVADGSGNMTVTVSPAIVFDLPRKNIYVAAGDTQIPAGAIVTLVPSHNANICYNQRSLVLAMPALQAMDSPFSATYSDKDSGVSIRASRTAEVLDNKNVIRLDAQMACGWVPQQAVRLITQPVSIFG